MRARSLILAQTSLELGPEVFLLKVAGGGML